MNNVTLSHTKKGPGRKHAQGADVFPRKKVLKGVTHAPHWPGSGALKAKNRARSSQA